MRYLAIFFLLVLLAGCKKDDIPTFSGTDGISFYIDYYSDPDSISYSFALQATAKTRDTVFIPMRLVGKASGVDRGIKLKALTGSTARANVDYILPEVKLPANQLSINYPLIVLNSAEMKTKTFKVILGVDPASELVEGSAGTVADYSKNLKQMKINITGLLIKPSYWTTDIDRYYGTFSVTKFQFMIKTTGLLDFSPSVIGVAALYRLQAQLKTAIALYNQANGPLIDEFGNPVTF